MSEISITTFTGTAEEVYQSARKGVRDEFDQFKKELKLSDPEKLMTRQEAADFFGVDLSTIWSWQKKIKAYGIGGRVYFKRTELLEVLTPIY